MITFIFYILPIILTILLVTFYSKYVDRDKCSFAPRLFRWLSLIIVFIPFFGIIIFGVWCYICMSKETEFKPNKITDFFINN